jgi:CDP-diacylglycerol--glycerol-3-phosphate 3-phosphatidyltransferase
MNTKPETYCDHHGCWHEPRDIWLTWANLVTAARTVAAVVLVMLAIAQHSTVFLYAGLLTYWVGDMADGMVARRLNRETRIGGTFDILCDRLCVALFYMTYATWHHNMLIPIGIFMVQFMVLDNFLTLSFTHWPLKSPNYFYLVDRWIYKWNWSPPAKALNSSALVLVMVLTKSPLAAGMLAAAIFTLKVVSLRRLQQVGLPEATGCTAEHKT